VNIAAEIRQLEELRATGALTDDEFQQAKHRVLLLDAPSAAPGQFALEYVPRICGVDERTWCTLLHLSPLLMYAGGIGLVVPIVMWAVGKDESELARAHGARMMNWLISSLIYVVISAILCIFIIGIPLLLMLAVLSILFPVMAAIKSTRNELWSYPLAIQFLDEDDFQDPEFYDETGQPV
jgi:uncharacterized Tic20 family protein